MTPKEMNQWMKENYDNINSFDNLPFIKSIRKDTAKKIFKNLKELAGVLTPEEYDKELLRLENEWCK